MVIVSLLLVACNKKNLNNSDYYKIQKSLNDDKNLSCQEILLTINDMEFYRQLALKNNKLINNLFSPANYVRAKKRLSNLEMRIEHLDRLYSIQACNHQDTVNKMVANAMSNYQYDSHIRYRNNQY